MNLTPPTPEPEDDDQQPTGKVVTVRAFGARLLGGDTAQQLATDIFLQQNRLWNKLVEVEREARQKYRQALLDSDTELQALQTQTEEKQLTLDSLMLARNSERASVRSKKSDNAPKYANQIKEVSSQIKSLRASMKELKVKAKEKAKPLIDAAELERRKRVKDAAKEAGLWWCHSEAIIKKFDVARVKAMKEGREINFHRFEGDGSMGVRFGIEGGAMHKIYAGKTDLLQIRDPLPEELGAHMKATKSDGGRRKIITVRAGDKDQDKHIPKLSFLVTLHADRDFPTDAPLKTVTISRIKHINKFEWKIIFTFSRSATTSEPLPDLKKRVAGVDLGFRLVRDQDANKALRVASIHFGDQVRYVTLDHQWIRRMEQADALRSRLDLLSNTFWNEIRQTLKNSNLQDLDENSYFGRLAGKVQRSKGAYALLLISLCTAHQEEGAPLGEDIDREMQAYRKAALVLATQAHHTRRKAVEYRKHLYRNVAAQLVKEVGMLGLIDTDFRKIAATKKSDGDDTELALTARRHRAWAAPSELRLAIVQAFKREKAELVEVPSENNTRKCSACGHVHSEPIKDLTFVCEGCAKVWDQDENSSNNCRNFALGEVETALESKA